MRLALLALAAFFTCQVVNAQTCYMFTQEESCDQVDEQFCTGDCQTDPQTGIEFCVDNNDMLQVEDENGGVTWDGVEPGPSGYVEQSRYTITCSWVARCQCVNIAGSNKCVVELATRAPISEEVIVLNTDVTCDIYE